MLSVFRYLFFFRVARPTTGAVWDASTKTPYYRTRCRRDMLPRRARQALRPTHLPSHGRKLSTVVPYPAILRRRAVFG
jgi:hypothetical protein